MIDRKELEKTLNRAKDIVESWPAWKKGLLDSYSESTKKHTPTHFLPDGDKISPKGIYAVRCGKDTEIFKSTDKCIYGRVLCSFGWMSFEWGPDGRAYTTDLMHPWDLVRKNNPVKRKR